jgi:hypothetical protein
MSARVTALDRAVARREVRQFRGGVPCLWVLEFGGQTIHSCPALGVGESLAGDPQILETSFIAELRAAAGRVDPATAPGDAIATALAIERATDDDLRSWIRPRDPAVEFAAARREAEARTKDRDPRWQLH